jgi:DNA-binding response OmpR family regulator
MGVIALTRRSLRGKLDALERGADDYIGIPFVPDDLVAPPGQRSVGPTTNTGAFVARVRVGDLEFDVLKRTVIVGEHEVHLSSLDQALHDTSLAGPAFGDGS